MNDKIFKTNPSDKFTLTCNKCQNTDKQKGILIKLALPSIECLNCGEKEILKF